MHRFGRKRAQMGKAVADEKLNSHLPPIRFKIVPATNSKLAIRKSQLGSKCLGIWLPSRCFEDRIFRPQRFLDLPANELPANVGQPVAAAPKPLDRPLGELLAELANEDVDDLVPIGEVAIVAIGVERQVNLLFGGALGSALIKHAQNTVLARRAHGKRPDVILPGEV